MTLFDLLGGRALRLALFGRSFWGLAIPLIASGLGALFGAKKKKTPSASEQTQSATTTAMQQLLGQQTAQMNEEMPLRRLLLGQSANLLPTYMKSDPNYAQWLQSSAPGVQAAMNAAVRRTPYDVG